MDKRTLAVGIAALLASAAAPVLAHETDGRGTVFSWIGDWDPSFYAGVSLHQGAFEDWSVSQLTRFTTRNEDDSDVGFRLSGGMQIVEHLAIEASYADFGEARFTGDSDGTGPFAPGPVGDRVRADGYGLHLVGRLPVAGNFDLAGKAGVWSLRTEQTASGSLDVGGPFSSRESGSSTEFSYAVALEYTGFGPIRVAMEYEVTDLDAPLTPSAAGSEIRSLGVSLQYRFERAEPGPGD
jgi:hypothetical protein